MYLEVKNLVKYYNKELPIIRKLEFSVKKGEIISFLGESGSGKTTFLKCIAGLEKIHSGSILLNNVVSYSNIMAALTLNLIYFTLAIAIFYAAFAGARKKGTLINVGE